MANPHKGEVELAVGEKRYTLRFSIDAICQLEAASQLPFALLAVKMSNPALATVTLARQALHAGLSETHPDIDLKKAGEMIVPAGGIVNVLQCVADAMQAAFPEIGAATAHPPKGPRGRRGTGRPS